MRTRQARRLRGHRRDAHDRHRLHAPGAGVLRPDADSQAIPLQAARQPVVRRQARRPPPRSPHARQPARPGRRPRPPLRRTPHGPRPRPPLHHRRRLRMGPHAQGPRLRHAVRPARPVPRCPAPALPQHHRRRAHRVHAQAERIREELHGDHPAPEPQLGRAAARGRARVLPVVRRNDGLGPLLARARPAGRRNAADASHLVRRQRRPRGRLRGEDDGERASLDVPAVQAHVRRAGHGQGDQQIAVKAPASNLWKYLLGAILGLLVLETWLAQMFGAKR